MPNTEVYEGKILEKLIENSERLAVIEAPVREMKPRLERTEDKIDRLQESVQANATAIATLLEEVAGIKNRLSWFIGLLLAIGTGILGTLYSQPILSALNR